jgi:hypothetical protein
MAGEQSKALVGLGLEQPHGITLSVPGRVGVNEP